MLCFLMVDNNKDDCFSVGGVKFILCGNNGNSIFLVVVPLLWMFSYI